MQLFRSLGHRNFRLFFAGQLLSLVGTWMQMTASPWLVYRLTDDAFLLGLVTCCGQLPAFFLGPLAGVVADRVNKRRLIVVTQVVAMLQAFTLAGLTLAGGVTVWHVLVLNLILSSVSAFDLTARQAFLKDMLEDKADLGNAIALNSAMFNSARLVGPALAGALIAAFGEGACFLANGVSYLAVLASLLAMRLAPASARPATVAMSWWHNFREGLGYTFGSPPIRSLISLVALASLFAVPYAVLMPVYVRTVLHAGAAVNGLLLSSAGVGSLAGAVWLASRRGVAHLLPLAARCPFVTGLALAMLALAPPRPELAAVLLALVGLSVVLMLASCNTLVQSMVDDGMRGRVMSLYATAFLGLGPLGNLLAGWAAAALGVGGALVMGGVACVIGGVAFAAVLPGLRPQVAAGLGRATEVSESATD
jgi:MFS family permease